MELFELVDFYYPSLNSYDKSNLGRYNCAEGMIRGIEEYYELNISDDAKAQMEAFGGGMGVGSVCGLLVGSYAGLSHLSHSRRIKNDLSLRRITQLWNETFTNHFNSINCVDLKSTGGCRSNVVDTCNLFVAFIGEYYE